MRMGRIGSFGEDKAIAYLQDNHYQLSDYTKKFSKKMG